MKTAKDKAYQLVKKYYKLTATDNRSYAFEDAIILHHTKGELKAVNRAKLVALTAVEDILDALSFLRNVQNIDDISSEYWDEVKQEIENIK